MLYVGPTQVPIQRPTCGIPDLTPGQSVSAGRRVSRPPSLSSECAFGWWLRGGRRRRPRDSSWRSHEQKKSRKRENAFLTSIASSKRPFKYRDGRSAFRTLQIRPRLCQNRLRHVMFRQVYFYPHLLDFIVPHPIPFYHIISSFYPFYSIIIIIQLSWILSIPLHVSYSIIIYLIVGCLMCNR